MVIILCYKNNAWDFSYARVTIVFELQLSHGFAILCWLRCQEIFVLSSFLTFAYYYF